MKEKELRQHAICNYCALPIGIPTFHTVEVKSYVLNFQVMQRQQGLGMMIGGALAMVMGPDEDLALETEHKKLTMCAECFALQMPEPKAEAEGEPHD
jgi:hypothetical protein